MVCNISSTSESTNSALCAAHDYFTKSRWPRQAKDQVRLNVPPYLDVQLTPVNRPRKASGLLVRTGDSSSGVITVSIPTPSSLKNVTHSSPEPGRTLHLSGIV